MCYRFSWATLLGFWNWVFVTLKLVLVIHKTYVKDVEFTCQIKEIPFFFKIIQPLTMKTYQRRWTIGRSGERGSGISVLAARHDDDDEEDIWESSKNVLSFTQNKLEKHFSACTQMSAILGTHLSYVYIYIHIYRLGTHLSDILLLPQGHC